MDYFSEHLNRNHYITDVEHKVAENSLIRIRPAEEWIDGHPLGNGDLGVMAVGSPACFRFYFSKANVWDNRTVMDDDSVFPKQTFQELTRLVKEGNGDEFNRINTAEVVEYSRTNYPSPQSCGILTLKCDRSTHTHFSQILDLYKGEDRICWQTEKGSYELLAFVHQHRNISEYRVGFSDLEKNWLDLSVGRIPSDLFEAEKAFCQGEFLGFVFTFPDGLQYVNVLTVQSDQPVQVEEGRITMPMATSCRLRILQTIVTSEESEDPRAEAIGRLEACLAEEENEAKRESERFWKSFWNRSYIDLESREVEKTWYMGIYLIGSSSRRGSPAMPGLQGVWIENYSPPWKGDYHTDLNIEMNYWPVYISNHLDLAEPFYRCYKNLITKFKKDTRAYYGTEGIKVPIAHDLKGNYLAGYIGGLFWQGSSAWIASHFWRNFLYTQDEKFLREIAYPFFIECIRYYNTVLEKEETGRYIVAMSWTPEEMEADQIQAIDDNPTIDLSHIRNLYEAFLKTVKILGEEVAENAEVALARDILTNLADYPRQKGPSDEQTDRPYLKDSENCDFDYCHRHLSVLTPIYPSGELNGYSSSRELYSLGLNTFHKYIKRGNASRRRYFCLTYTWLASVAATLGLEDSANHFLADYLDTYANDNFLNTSFDHQKKGRGVHVGDIQEFSVGSEYEFSERIFQIESNTCAAEAVNLLLLQSFGGEICVFPAYPWKNGSFEGLRAQGGFLVSSEMKEGRIESLFIESLYGNRCTVYLDGRIRNVTVCEAGSGSGVKSSGPENNEIGNKIRFSFETRPACEYEIVVEY